MGPPHQAPLDIAPTTSTSGTSYFHAQMAIEEQATKILHATPALPTALMPPAILRARIEKIFGKKAAKPLVSATLERTNSLQKRLSEGALTMHSLVLESALKAQLAATKEGRHREWKDHLKKSFFASPYVKIKVISQALRDDEFQMFSLAEAIGAHRGFLAISDQPFNSLEVSRNCSITPLETPQARIPQEMFASYWNDSSSKVIDQRDFLGMLE